MDPERPPQALISELLEEIFLRVASPADLARASAACVSFRRLIADPSFLRRYRSLHPPLLLGLVNSSGFQPVEAPQSSAAVARAVAFSFDFLPRTSKRGDCWYPCDVRDGRVLVECPRGGLVWDLAVCDPLSQRYLLLPPITRDLLASVGLDKGLIFHAGASFIPLSGGVEEDTSFRVITWIQSDPRLGVFIFSSGSSCWSVSTSVDWGDLGLDQVNIMVSGQCAYDCFYWKLCATSMVIKLDMNSMQFCTVDLPLGHDEREIAVVDSGGSKLAMFSHLISGGRSVDYYTFPENGSEKSHEWHIKSTIPLPAHCTVDGECSIGGPHEGYIFIQCIPLVGPKTNKITLFLSYDNTSSFTLQMYTPCLIFTTKQYIFYISPHTLKGYIAKDLHKSFYRLFRSVSTVTDLLQCLVHLIHSSSSKQTLLPNAS